MTQYNNDSNDEKILSRFFVEREGEGVLGSLKNIDLIDSGILDSLDIVTLASFIEEEFAVKLDLTDTNTFNAVRRFDSLIELIQK